MRDIPCLVFSRTGMVEFLNVMSSMNIKDVVAIIILAEFARLFHRVGERGVCRWEEKTKILDVMMAIPVRGQNTAEVGIFLHNDKPG